MTEITIGIVSYNRINVLTDTLDILSKQTIPCKVIICDDGSRDIINPNKYPIISKYLWNKDAGYTRVERLNQIMNECNTRYLIYLDDDCIPQSYNFVEYYLSELKKYDVVRGIISFYGGQTASSWFSCANVGFNLNKIKELGGFDMNYNGNYGYEDVDIGKMIEKAGYSVSLFPEGTNVLHVCTMKSGTIFGDNEKYFKEKWNL